MKIPEDDFFLLTKLFFLACSIIYLYGAIMSQFGYTISITLFHWIYFVIAGTLTLLFIRTVMLKEKKQSD